MYSYRPGIRHTIAAFVFLSLSLVAQGQVESNLQAYFAPYWTVGEGFESSVVINNTLNRPIEARLTLYNHLGDELRLPELLLEPLESKTISLNQMLASVRSEHQGFGSARLEYQGRPLELPAQMVISNRALSLSWSSLFVNRSFFSSSRLEALFWLPFAGTRAKVVLSNTSEKSLKVSETITVAGVAFKGRGRILKPHETELVSLDEALRAIGKEGSGVGGISIAHDGSPGDLLVQGIVEERARGFSSNIAFVDLARRSSSKLFSPGLKLGGLDFSPYLVLRNTKPEALDVDVIVHYNQSGEARLLKASTISLGPAESRLVDLREHLGPLEVNGAGLELVSASPDALLAELVSIDRMRSLAIESRPKDPASEGHPGFSFPWRIDGGYNTQLNIMNPSEKEADYCVFLFFEGQNYTYTGKRLKAGEVLQIDIKRLRDERVPDEFGRVIPGEATQGQAKLMVHGSAKKLLGEALIFSETEGVSHTLGCQACPPNATRLDVMPNSITGQVGESKSISAFLFFNDGSFKDVSAQAFYNSSNSFVADVVVDSFLNAAFVRLKWPGTASIDACMVACKSWNYNIAVNDCECLREESVCDSNSSFSPAQVTVGPVVRVITADITSDRIEISLHPSAASGRLVATLIGDGGNVILSDAVRSGGNHILSFNPANLPSRQYTAVRADWTINGVTGTDTRGVSFRVLGTYRHSQYNTPSEATCTGLPEDAFITNAACAFTSTTLRSDFISQVNLNGSGRSINFGDVVREVFCIQPSRNPPPNSSGRSFRQQQIVPACSGQGLSDATVARMSGHPHLNCGDQVLIVGLGANPGTIKTVTDLCPGCPETQLDNYTTDSRCSDVLDLGSFVTIRLR